MNLTRVNNVNEAISLAEGHKQKGTYDWFRGQVGNWPMVSTLVRVKPEKKDDEIQKMARFESWIRMTPGLEELAGDTDATIAVAQHYGLATPFVDFSTEPRVAGFFATYGLHTEGKESCLICLDTADLAEFWRSMPSEYPPPEFLRITVANLWRLEAQFGTFLFCPYGNFETIYDLDRIVFPYTGRVDRPRLEEIYPVRKSNLELLLDQFFMNETLIEGMRKTESVRSKMTTIYVESPEFDPELIEGDKVPKHHSWDPTKLRLWLTPVVEQFSNSVTDETWELKIDSNVEPNVIGKKVSEDVLRKLQEKESLRSKLVSWSLEGKDATDSFLPKALQWLWDGLRTLPYDNEDIATGIGNCVALYLNRKRVENSSYDPWLDAASASFGESMEVEFGAADASYSRAYVADSALLGAVRKDIEPFLASAYREQLVDNMTGLLQAMTSPVKLFDFDLLAKLFAQQIGPSQVLMRFAGDSKHGAHAIFLSPARLDKLGLP